MARKEKVTGVRDGDSFKTSLRKKDVRLAGVEAPEKGERGYIKAKKTLRNLIENEEVRIETVARDKYGRAVANVYVGRESVNKKMKQILKQ